jgi:hypothetical protein
MIANMCKNSKEATSLVQIPKANKLAKKTSKIPLKITNVSAEIPVRFVIPSGINDTQAL